MYVVANPVRGLLDRKRSKIRGTSINQKLQQEHENKTKTKRKQDKNDKKKKGIQIFLKHKARAGKYL